ncbi:MAG: sugar phosphate nucleotidyltransferase [Halohasta sp.]
MYGVVPAAGNGTRLRPLTDETPKAMVEVAGRPLVSHVFDRLLAVGVDHLVVVVGYEMGAIVDRFGDRYRETPITYVHQREQLGLGHAIARCEPVVSGTFVVCNGDNVFETPQRAAVDRARASEVDAVLLVEDVSREAARKTGVVETDGDRVRRVVEKPAEPPSRLSTTGWYVLPEEIFPALELLRPSDRGEYELADAVSVLATAGATIETVPLDGRRVNVNTPADVDRAEALLADR